MSGVVNEYYSVSNVSTNSITCGGEDLSTLAVGDKVLLIQMTGASFDSDWSVINNTTVDAESNSGGKYEFLSVLSVNYSTKEITFTQDLENTYETNETIQLVKAFVSYDAVVESTLTAKDWDGSTGGVAALIVLGNLSLNANIDLSGKGFRGAEALDYTEACREVSESDTMYFDASVVNKGGEKGEGIKGNSFTYTVGPGNNFNGGGGGVGRFGGGGGGSNYDVGGFGGGQQGTCGISTWQRGSGGFGLETGNLNYTISGGDFYSIHQKLTMGGGGGGSTYNGTLTSQPGGDGGGLLIIMADTLIGNGDSLIANGNSVTGISTAGAGGGGAGGTIVLDVASFKNAVNISLQGGDGGSTSGTTDCGGAGASGAGGAFLTSSASVSSNIDYDLSYGQIGSSSCGNDQPIRGNDGGTIIGYDILLNGFTFNAVSENDTICYGQNPKELIGTIPKGSSNYQFRWFSKNNLSDPWDIISGATSKNYDPPVLYDTMYYTREVTFPESGIVDTAQMVTIIVLPTIKNNTLTLRDTICIGATPLLTAKTVSGGDGSYSYIWESSVDNTTWNQRSTSAILSENALTATTYYRRSVNSGPDDVCSSTSAVDTITVLPAVSNNQILNSYSDTLICKGLAAGKNLGSLPAGGDGSFSYQWISSSDSITYSKVTGATGKNYQPAGIPTATLYYKRIVYSGEGDACVDTTSDRRKIEVIPIISNNNITTDSSRYCEGDLPSSIVQSTPAISGGNGTYTYQWQEYSGSWNDIDGETLSSYQADTLYDSVQFRRIAYSGYITDAVYACESPSNVLAIDVIPAIENTLVSPDETICQGIQPDKLSESVANGGANTYNYLWQQNINGDGWTDAAGTNNQVSYNPVVLYSSTEFRRFVTSQICSSESNAITITVLDSLTSNYIEGASIQYTCYNSPAELTGSTPAGGDGTFSYSWQSSEDLLSWTNTSKTDQHLESSNLLLSTYFRRVVMSGTGNACTDTSDYVRTNINALPTGDIIGGIDTLCAGDLIEVGYSGLTGPSPWTIEIGDDEVIHTEAGITSDSGSFSFELSAFGSLKAINIIDDSLCYADQSTLTNEMQALVFTVPIADAGDDDEVCGTLYTLGATLSTSGSGYWQIPDGDLSSETSPSAQVTVETYGEKEFIWTEVNWQCVDQDEVIITFYEQPIEVNAGEDQVLPYTFETQLSGNEPETPASGYWSFVTGAGEFDDSTLYDATIELPTVGNYELSWTIINGVCIPISDNMVIAIEDLELDNGFSPNNDGINDEYVFTIPSGNDVKLTIIDRNGNLVFQITGQYEIKWDGTNKTGQDVPEDTYFYIIEEESASVRKGFIELRR